MKKWTSIQSHYLRMQDDLPAFFSPTFHCYFDGPDTAPMLHLFAKTPLKRRERLYTERGHVQSETFYKHTSDVRPLRSEVSDVRVSLPKAQVDHFRDAVNWRAEHGCQKETQCTPPGTGRGSVWS